MRSSGFIYDHVWDLSMITEMIEEVFYDGPVSFFFKALLFIHCIYLKKLMYDLICTIVSPCISAGIDFCPHVLFFFIGDAGVLGYLPKGREIEGMVEIVYFGTCGVWVPFIIIIHIINKFFDIMVKNNKISFLDQLDYKGCNVSRASSWKPDIVVAQKHVYRSIEVLSNANNLI